ncbi:glutathione S-transferase [Rhizobiales bacterium GAS113]|nr:glutathione S-transferase [Rhizobiales bacterium GAS113]
MRYGTKIKTQKVETREFEIEENIMELYFAPLACSLATRITLYEAGADATFRYVDTKAKRTADGGDFLAVNKMGQVPVLRTDAGELLTENPAILQFVADQYPDAGLAPEKGMERYRLQQWLNFITSELHKVVYIPLLDHTSTEGAKAYARSKTKARFDFLDAHLREREYLLDRFTIADAYLVTVLNWSKTSGIDLANWPAVLAYFKRLHKRPSVAKAFAEELALFTEEQARKDAA